MSHPYDYRVRNVRKVVDGDTVDLELDLGLYLSATLRFRLLGVDAPDGSDAAEAPARAFVASWLADHSLGRELRVRTYKADSFGRWLGDVYSPHPDDLRPAAHLSNDLLAAGLAVPYRR